MLAVAIVEIDFDAAIEPGVSLKIERLYAAGMKDRPQHSARREIHRGMKADLRGLFRSGNRGIRSARSDLRAFIAIYEECGQENHPHAIPEAPWAMRRYPIPDHEIPAFTISCMWTIPTNRSSASTTRSCITLGSLSSISCKASIASLPEAIVRGFFDIISVAVTRWVSMVACDSK